jgi:hypothetical protein
VEIIGPGSCLLFERTAAMFALLVVLALPALPQSTAATPAVGYPYLLRVQRVIPHLDTCVLLRRDGGYHLERDHEESTEVYEGELSAEELSRLEAWLDDEQLRQLTREQIMTPLVSQARDEVQINIFRGDHWQNLLFLSSESRTPFHALTPLLEWFNALHNAPHRTISEDAGKTNCMTPGKIVLSTRPSPSGEPAKNAQPQGQNLEPPAQAPGGQAVLPSKPDSYLLRLLHESFDRSGVDSTCAIVYASGLYRVEHASQAFGGKVHAKVYQSMVGESQRQELQHLLEDAHLKAIEMGNLPDEFFEKLQAGHSSMDIRFLLSDATFVWIPREKAVQNLAFASDLRVQAAIGNHYLTSDKNAKYVRPLEKWVKSELPVEKSVLVDGATASFCAPK